MTVSLTRYHPRKVEDNHMIVADIYEDHGDMIVACRYNCSSTHYEHERIDRFLGFVPKIGDKVDMWHNKDIGYVFTQGHTNNRHMMVRNTGNVSLVEV